MSLRSTLGAILIGALALANTASALAQTAAAPAQDAGPQIVRLERDDLRIERSCVIDPSGGPIVDANGDGVIHIVGEGVVVSFTRTPLFGAPPERAHDELSGVGIRVLADNVTVRGARISGFKCGLWASGADGLVVEGCNFEDNFRQRLRSTPAAEDLSDWLWPHDNDANQWLEKYGAAIYVEDSAGVTLRLNTARRGQNGICLRRVDDSRVFDNDMSFLSGWGLALYRSSRNVVDHNSFDFCVRGYSHGVYSRGQDSAGILMFEQCSDNLLAFNSATHGGDGFFGFAGVEALEGAGVEHAGRGCNRNRLHGNDFSYAPAIGIEMTFSFDNVFDGNKLVGGNYGVWGGYSQRTLVENNEIADNALAGVAVEHGRDWRISGNRFARNARAVELWWDDDKDLLAKPWAKANGGESIDNEVSSNSFDGDTLALELRGGARAWFDGPAEAPTKVDEASRLEREWEPRARELAEDPRLATLLGTRAAVGGRAALAGRDKILVTEWGPYDWASPLLWRAADDGESHVYRLLGPEVALMFDAGPAVRVQMDVFEGAPRYKLSARKSGAATPYELKVRLPSRELVASGLMLPSKWRVGVAAYQTDPREDAAKWRKEIEAAAVWFERSSLVLPYGSGGPSQLPGAPPELAAAGLPRERFGTLASTRLELPAGTWSIVTRSDDGVRVRVDGALLIDNWTHHAPTRDEAEFTLEASAAVQIEVEHFELDGFALLELELKPRAR